MATITTGAMAAFSNGASTGTGWVGYSYSTPRVIRYAFTVPAGGCTSLSIGTMEAGRSISNPPSASDLANVRFYIGTSATSHVNAAGGGYAYSGTLTHTGYNSSTGRDSFTLSCNINLTAGTYYLFFFPGFTSNNVYFNFSYTSTANQTLTITTSGSYANVTLTISAGSGSSISVTRNGVGLSSGATVTTGDVLVISFAAVTGYRLTSQTVNGSAFAGGQYVVGASNVAVAASATRLSYTLTIDADANSLVTVTRGGSALQSGDTIYYGDALTVTAAARSGYEVASAEINGTAFSGTKSVSVTGAVVVVVTSSALGFAYLHHNGAFIPYLIYVWLGGAWQRYRAYVWKNGAWTAH